MKRRNFVAILGGGAAAWPLAARGQQPAPPVIGVLNSESADLSADRLRAFRDGLGEIGFREGHNVTIEYRWAEGRHERLPALAADLIARQVSVIVAPDSTPMAMAAKAATTTIPIVFRIGTDPVAAGLVASLNRPGGNLTGVTTLGVELGPKRLELMRELAPRASAVALLVNPTNPTVAVATVRELQAGAAALGLQLHVLRASSASDIDAAFASLIQLRPGGLVIGGDAFFNSQSEQLATLALRHAIPAIYQFREFAVAGGLLSYGGSTTEAYRLVGVYAGRILKGEKPADLPVQQATKIELIVNLKTAKALGLTIPDSLFARADEVIE